MAIETIDQALCSGCGKCVTACSVDVIRMNSEKEKDKKKAIIRYQEDCMLCRLCLHYCRTGAISLSDDTRDPLYMGWGY